MDQQGNRFQSDRTRIKVDWELILQQLPDTYRRLPSNRRRQQTHDELLDRLDKERACYATDLERTYGGQHRQLHMELSESPDWIAIRQRHWSEFRAERRRLTAWLCDVEERLDAVFSAAIQSG